MTPANTGGNRGPTGGALMASDNQLTREEFNRMAEHLGVGGDAAYLDELYTQVRGVFIGAKTIREIDVSGAEPDMAFVPPAGEPPPLARPCGIKSLKLSSVLVGARSGIR